MEKIGHTIDANGFLSGDVLAERKFDAEGNFIGFELNGELITPDIASICPEGFYTPKWNGVAWVEGLTQAEIDAIRNAPQPPSTEDKVTTIAVQANQLDERTLGMQDIDFFTLQSLQTTEERTAGMQDIDEFTLTLVFEMQATIDQMRAEIDQLKGGA